MSDVQNYLYQSPRTLPVILLLDTSGTMNENNKIGVMNSAVMDMLRSFKGGSNTIASISVAIITFGGPRAKIHLEMTSADELDLDAMKTMTAGGMTPMGDAITLAKNIIEDKEQISSRSYRPTVVLVTDGLPNDQWVEPLRAFKDEGRSSKCHRMAMGIGVDRVGEAYDVLKDLTGDEEMIFSASEADEISRFFKYVTMSMNDRLNSPDPNAMPPMGKNLEQPKIENDDADDDFPF